MTSLMRLAAVIFTLASLTAQAGGPLSVCSSTHAPVKYPGAGNVTLRYDQGTLGSRTKAQADAIVTNAISLWTSVPTATITLARGADLPTDVTTANYTTYFQNSADGINPVIYDTNGSIIDSLYGTGASGSILGFAGSSWSGCNYVEGQAVISGAIAVDDVTMTTVIAHEVGHLIGLDHTQLDNSQGLTPNFPSNYPLMYPIAYRDFVSLHEDDVAAVSALYPDATLNSVYGQVSGNFVLADGVTPVRGANLWATETSTGRVYSIVSDYLMQNTGYFRLLLPAGTYTLRAEAIQSSFTGGSSVGPYSDSSSDPSFLSPLYSGTTPMATVVLGNATPTTFTIAAGCAATVTFRLNGTGTVSGCGPAAPTPASITSPAPGVTLGGASQAFTWSNAGASAYQLFVGNSVGSYDIGAFPPGGTAATSTTINGLPTDGRTLYVRLYSSFAGVLSYRDYTYKAATVASTTPASMVSPAPGSTLGGSSQTFSWSNAGASVYQIFVGNSVGSYDIGAYPPGGTAATSATVAGLPTDGRTLYVRLYSSFAGALSFRDYTYRAATATAPTPASLLTPSPGATLSGATQTFTWSNAGAGVYQIFIGNSVGSYDIGAYPPGGTSARTATVTGLPTDGRTIYVRLYSSFSGALYWRDYTYRTGR